MTILTSSFSFVPFVQTLELPLLLGPQRWGECLPPLGLQPEETSPFSQDVVHRVCLWWDKDERKAADRLDSLLGVGEIVVGHLSLFEEAGVTLAPLSSSLSEGRLV